MFKRVSILFFTFIFFIIIGQVNLSASELNNVKDYLDYLTESEEADLQSAIDSMKTDHNLDAVVVITDNTDGKSSMEFADDYYDNNGYGIGNDYSGLLMLINMDQREVWISTTGRAIDIFTDTRISYMVDNVTGSLSEGKYYEASNTFINDIRYYAEKGVPRGQYREEAEPYYKSTYFDRALRLMTSFPVYVIALIVSLIATIVISLSSKGKITIDSHTYEEKGSFVLSGSRDDFIRESTTRTIIETKSSGSGSSIHTGSSGRSHGGGGGSF